MKIYSLWFMYLKEGFCFSKLAGIFASEEDANLMKEKLERDDDFCRHFSWNPQLWIEVHETGKLTAIVEQLRQEGPD